MKFNKPLMILMFLMIFFICFQELILNCQQAVDR